MSLNANPQVQLRGFTSTSPRVSVLPKFCNSQKACDVTVCQEDEGESYTIEECDQEVGARDKWLSKLQKREWMLDWEQIAIVNFEHRDLAEREHKKRIGKNMQGAWGKNKGDNSNGSARNSRDGIKNIFKWSCGGTEDRARSPAQIQLEANRSVKWRRNAGIMQRNWILEYFNIRQMHCEKCVPDNYSSTKECHISKKHPKFFLFPLAGFCYGNDLFSRWVATFWAFRNQLWGISNFIGHLGLYIT